ncbi:MAG: HEAT repeat domain-containing protein [Planctomycetota bacterium]|nr:HEAT repeat domain-containing protein [Planctomycetota bacterium]
MTRYILLLLALLLLSFTSASMAEEASPELRIKKFKKTFLFNPQKAFGYLKPLDHPRLVSYVIDFWEKYGQLGYYYSSAAEEAVMTTKGEKALGELYGQMMRHDKSWMRANLARVVGKIKKPGCDKALMVLFRARRNLSTPPHSSRAAQTYPSKDMERMIFKFTRSGYRPEVRLVAVEALGVMGSEDSVRAIAKLAVKDKTEIRCAALWALGNLKGEIALKTILMPLRAMTP